MKYDSGILVSALPVMYGMAKLTISTFLEYNGGNGS